MAFIKNEPIYGFPFTLINKSTGDPVVTGTVTGYYLVDGGAQTELTGTATHEGNGQWSWNTIPAAATNGDIIGLYFVHADAFPVNITIQTTTSPYGVLVAGTPSEVALVNLALDDLGAEVIESFTEDSDRARRCRRLYPQCRDELFDTIRPGCAIRRSLLAATTTPTFGWSYAFQLPTGFLHAIETDDDTQDWAVEGSTLVANRTPVYLSYVYRQEDVTKYPPKFTRALVAYLAARLAYAITKSAALAEMHWKLYEAAKDEALVLEGQQGTGRLLTNTVLTTDVRS